MSTGVAAARAGGAAAQSFQSLQATAAGENRHNKKALKLQRLQKRKARTLSLIWMTVWMDPLDASLNVAEDGQRHLKNNM